MGDEGDVTLDIHTDHVESVSWNTDGSQIVTTCKDNSIRVIDARKGQVLYEIKNAFEGAAAVTFLKDGKLFAVGFSKMNEGMYALYDPEQSCEEPLASETLGFFGHSGQAAPLPFYDQDTNIIFIAGSKQPKIICCEVTDEAPYIDHLITHSSNVNPRGMAWMPKRGCDVNECEIARFYYLGIGDEKLGICEPIAMTIPRESDLFQEDIFPDFCSDEPAMTAEEWVNGKTAMPKRASWREVFDANKEAAMLAP